MSTERRRDRDRRRSPRVRVQHEVRLTAPDEPGEAPFKATSIDLNLGGIYFHVDRHVAVFTKLALTLRLPLLDEKDQRHWFEVPVEGVVVRVEPEEAEPGRTDYSCALAFVHTDSDVELVIAKYLLQAMSLEN